MAVQDPMFSIVIPTYNRSAKVKEAIGSVLKQTFSDFEVIVSDDGSTDDTGDVVKEYRDSRVNYIFQPNSGVSSARKAGANFSKGRFLIFLDSDDQLTIGYLKRIHSELSSGNYLMVFGFARYEDSDGKQIVNVKPEKTEIFYGPQLAGAFTISRDLYEKVGGYDVNLRYSENTELFLRIKLSGLLPLHAISLVHDEGVIIHYIDSRTRFNMYASIKYKSIDYFLKKHAEHFARFPKDYVNYRSIYALGAFQNGESGEARRAMKDVILKKPTRLKSYISYLLFAIPAIGRLYWSTGRDKK